MQLSAAINPLSKFNFSPLNHQNAKKKVSYKTDVFRKQSRWPEPEAVTRVARPAS
jgi:hypothetical protein